MGHGKRLGSLRGSPSQTDLTPNEFGAQKFRHQPLAKASGMNVNDATKNQTMLRTSVRS